MKQNEVKVVLDTPEKIKKSIFRAYDIRGIVGEDLNENVAYNVGRALATEAQALGQSSIIVGRDARESSPSLQAALTFGIMASGVDVIDIGVVPTPVVYFATKTLSTQSGVMITGSHNPAGYNGIKMVLGGNTLTTDKVAALYDRIQAQDFTEGQGSLSEAAVIDDYLADIQSRITLKRPLKIVVDCGNGVAGLTASRLYKALGCEVVELYCELDGSFPNHHPDPSVADNMVDIQAAVVAEKADCGLAFDGDADRVGVVTDQGEIIWPDRLTMLLAEDVLSRKPGSDILFDVKCSNQLANHITACGGNPVMWKTGHSILKGKMIEMDAPMAGELSGHIFFQEDWYGFDDGVYVGARFMQVLAMQNKTADALFATLPNNVNTPEIKVGIADDKKFDFVDRLVAASQFEEATVTTIDGLRVDFSDGWVLVRPSNTTPCLTVRFEATTIERLEALQADWRQRLLAIDDTLDVPF